MKTYPRVLFLLLVLFAAIPWFVLWQRQGEAARLRTALDTLEKNTATERRVAAERTRALEEQLRKQGQELEESRATSGGSTLKPAEGPSFDAGIALPFGPKEREEMQRLHALHERAALETRFAGLFKKLKLSSEKLERFKSLLVERELSAADAMMAAHEQGLGPSLDPAAAQKLMAQAQGTVDRSLAELLGADDYARYDEYQRTLAQRALVEQLEKRLSYTDQPLSESQAQQMVNLLAATANANAGSNGPELHGDAVFIGSATGGPVHSFGGGPTISDEALARAQSMLSAAQLDALRDLQALQRAQRESMRTLPVPGGLRVSAPIGVSPPR